MRRVFAAVLAAALAAAAPAGGSGQQANAELAVCRDCHAGTGNDRVEALSHADSISCRTCHHVGFTNDPELAAERRIETCASCHESLAGVHEAVAEGAPDCAACHSIHGDPPPPDAAGAIGGRCSACHAEPHEAHAPDADAPPGCADCHAEHAAPGGTGAAAASACGSCHVDAHPVHAGVEELRDCAECHDVARPAGETSVPSGAAGGCLECHADTHPAHAGVTPEVGCVECHDFSVPAVESPPAAGPALLCASCHEEEQEAVDAGGHGHPAGGVGAAATPECASCHVTHRAPDRSLDGRGLALETTLRCLECHESEAVVGPYELTPWVGRSYADDYHGATVRFLAAEGAPADAADVLLCSDCHGAHDVGVLDRSQIAEVCVRCHEDADARLAGAWLGHQPVGPRNGTLVWLVRLFYYVLIPFMLGGLFLTIAFHLVDQRRKGARMRDAEGAQRLRSRLRGEPVPAQETVKRFSLTDRIEHVGAMVTFTLLVITGLPQTRPDLSIAQGTIAAFGGIASTRLIHRIVGFTFVALMLVHVVRAVRTAIRKRKLPVMVPTRKDFEDVLQTFRHYLFRAPLPRVGKFDFAQKFEYWGLFLGGLVMSGTGIVLVFPELVTQVLPGVVVAALRVMHGLEATFAVLVIVLWHSYGVILRPEIFPLDTSIFTGKMSVKRLKHEHALEYERAFPDRDDR